MKTTDPTLQAAAEAVATMADDTGAIVAELLEEALSAVELEQLLTVVRAAIAAPVLALHQPYRRAGHEMARCGNCRKAYPCSTVRALGVTE